MADELVALNAREYIDAGADRALPGCSAHSDPDGRTYPLEVVKADRWLRDPRHAALRGDLIARPLDAEAWDPSVKALVTFPSILRMMGLNLDWTEKLGNAFLAQQGDVMDAIQRLHHQAAAAGSLRSNPWQRVVPEGPGVVIEPANQALIYPPVYSPVVYWPFWAYPEYPPLEIVPLGYGRAVPFGISFGTGSWWFDRQCAGAPSTGADAGACSALILLLTPVQGWNR